jgi:hypothetical protein
MGLIRAHWSECDVEPTSKYTNRAFYFALSKASFCRLLKGTGHVASLWATRDQNNDVAGRSCA